MKNHILFSKLLILRVKNKRNTNIYNMKFSGCISNRRFSGFFFFFLIFRTAHKNFLREKT